MSLYIYHSCGKTHVEDKAQIQVAIYFPMNKLRGYHTKNDKYMCGMSMTCREIFRTFKVMHASCN